jgi:hypothetical protein
MDPNRWNFRQNHSNFSSGISVAFPVAKKRSLVGFPKRREKLIYYIELFYGELSELLIIDTKDNEKYANRRLK